MYSSFFNIRSYSIFTVIILFLVITIVVPISIYKDEDISSSLDGVLSGDYIISSSNFCWPAPGFTRITSKFGYRDKPTAGASSFHYGIDIAATTGSNLISAIYGKVVYADFNRSKWIHNKNRK